MYLYYLSADCSGTIIGVAHRHYSKGACSTVKAKDLLARSHWQWEMTIGKKWGNLRCLCDARALARARQSRIRWSGRTYRIWALGSIYYLESGFVNYCSCSLLLGGGGGRLFSRTSLALGKAEVETLGAAGPGFSKGGTDQKRK